MQNASRFQKGSGVYTCICCGKRTRATGTQDHENVEMCRKCFEEGQEDNAKADKQEGAAA